jgi:undecaprenyl-diphosphatase
LGFLTNIMEELNIATFLFINQYAGKNNLVDTALISFAEVTPYICILLIIYLWFSDCIERKKSSFNSGLSVLFGMLMSYMISLFYYHSRPFVDGLGVQLVEHAPDSSFPSDHTTFIFSISVMLLFNKSTRTIGIILFFISIISGVSRVFVGVHFPLDILSAIFVAIISSVVVLKLECKTKFLLHFFIKITPYKQNIAILLPPR